MDRRLVVTVAIAGALHAAFWAVVRPYERTAIPHVPPEPTEIDVELSPELAPTDEPTGTATEPSTHGAPKAAEPAPPKVAVRPRPVPQGTPGEGQPSTPSEPARPPEGEPAPPAQQAPSSEPAAPPVAGGEPAKPKIPPLIDLSSPGKHAIILPTPGGPTPGGPTPGGPTPGGPNGGGKGKPDVPLTPEEAAAKKLDAELKASLDAHDAAKGSNFGGPVASAAHAASLGSHAPQTGWATFDVFTDAAGNVTGVKVMDFDVDPQGWAEVAKRMRSALAAQKLRVPHDANGVHVRVRVEASMRLPSGATKGVALSKNGMGVDFDVSDIGASKTRVVTVRVIGEGRM